MGPSDVEEWEAVFLGLHPPSISYATLIHHEALAELPFLVLADICT